jgi:hypothetical protein
MNALAKEASGLRHLRWGRETLASVEAHIEHNPRLEAADREALREEARIVRDLVARLSAAVKAYRDFLERTRVGFRARQRVGSFLVEEARRKFAAGIDGAESARLAGDQEEAAALLELHKDAYARMEEEQRRPLKAAVRGATTALREGLDQMNARLSARIGVAFVKSLYPKLTARGLMVADEDDEDDDASAPPDDAEEC